MSEHAQDEPVEQRQPVDEPPTPEPTQEPGLPAAPEPIEAIVSPDHLDEPEVVGDAEPEAHDEPAPEPEQPTWTRFDVTDESVMEEALAAAVAAIRAGECIVLPTDTVYGIGVRAQDAAAVTRLLEAKGRGRDMPPPVLVADTAMVGALVDELTDYALGLASQFWPGPLTLILTAQEGLGMDLGDTEGTIAVRVPDHEFARQLLRRTGPLAVSSANISGQPASTSIDDAIAQLGNSVAVYLDSGDTPGSAPSSIVDFTVSSAGELVRLGALDEGILLAYAPLMTYEKPVADEPAPEVDQPAEDEPADEVATDGVPTDDGPQDDLPADEAPAEDAPTVAPSTEETRVDAPPDDVPPVQETPTPPRNAAD
ncbi:L-threonylcarbamoyladenylate synthase [Aestuariimicrobium ganziense]|uniref:L-threonylcarbamoyladenylate synthase n=1 Tax=Aestuariimicrobium ganziense TaxID=2773677 RepID=UPI002E2B1A5B|nr:L-threonylcarbamoyladenylate synthase [Aestuariimicrobium ganziense]